MRLSGSAELVFTALREKKRLMACGSPHGHIQPMLIICAGVMRGVYGAGAVVALEEEGFGDVFEYVVGLSTGAPTAAYFLAGQSRIGATIYSEECVSKDFLNMWRFSNPLDAGYITSVFRESPTKKLGVEEVLSHRTRLLIAVTHHELGEQRFIEHEGSAERLFKAIQASCAVPGLNTDVVMIDGERHVDGACADPLPIHLADTLGATHVLIVANRDAVPSPRTSFVETFLNASLFRNRTSPAVRRAMTKRRMVMRRNFEAALAQKEIPTAVVWGDGSVGRFCRSQGTLRSVTERSRKWWIEQLRDHG